VTSLLRNTIHNARRFSSFSRATIGGGIQHLDPLDRSFMRIVGGDVDVHSNDFRANYDLMMAKNAELDDIVAKTLDVGQR